jgi:hypothetical protein
LRRAAWIVVCGLWLALSASSVRAQTDPSVEGETGVVPETATEIAGESAEESAIDASGEMAAPSDPTEEPSSEAAPSTSVREAGEPPSIPRREVPDYDGRPEPGPTGEEALLWIPRVLFFPLHVVFEYVLRQPIGWFLTTAEREEWSTVLIDFFTWGERKAGIVPTAFFDFGFIPSVGVYFWWNDLAAPGHQLRAQVGFGGVDWLRATVSNRVQTSAETELSLTADAWRRPDYVFQGLGWDARNDQRSRFIRSYVRGDMGFRFRPWRASEIAFAAGVTWNDFQPEGYSFTDAGQERSLGTAVAQGLYPTPPGFEGYTAYRQRLSVVIDSREERPAPGHGVRIEGFVEQGFDLQRILESRWIHYGGSAGAFVDLGNHRVLALWGHAQLADPLGSAPVPFLEQVVLGGEALRMGGFLPGQLIGRSAAVVTLEYRYPVWVFLDGSLHVAAGNVFGEHFSDFDVERLRMSFGLGLRSVGDRDQSFNFMVAFGTAPFVNGTHVESIRLVFGSQQGF